MVEEKLAKEDVEALLEAYDYVVEKDGTLEGIRPNIEIVRKLLKNGLENDHVIVRQQKKIAALKSNLKGTEKSRAIWEAVANNNWHSVERAWKENSWHLMDTAPKDGERIIVKTSTGKIQVVRWVRGYWTIYMVKDSWLKQLVKNTWDKQSWIVMGPDIELVGWRKV